MKILKERRGEFTVKGAMLFMLVMMLIVLSVSVIGVVNRMAVLHGMSAKLVRYIEIRGMNDSNVDNEIERVLQSSGLDCDVDIDAEFIAGTNKIQFGDPIRVTVAHTARFGVGGILAVPVSLTSRAEGRSEVYWKS